MSIFEVSGGHKEQNWVVGGHQKNVDFWHTVWMQIWNGIYKSAHDFKAAKKFNKFKVFIKSLKLWNFCAVLKPCLDLMMLFKNYIWMRIAIFWRHAWREPELGSNFKFHLFLIKFFWWLFFITINKNYINVSLIV